MKPQCELNYGMMILMMIGMMNRLLGAQFLEEGVVWDETIFILLWCELSKGDPDLFLLHGLSQGGKDVLKLSEHHGAILLFVIEFHTFNEVFITSLALLLLDGLVHGHEVTDLHHSLTLLLWWLELGDRFLRWVQVNGTEEVSDVEGIDFTLAIEIEDVESELDFFCFSHLVCLSATTARDERQT